MLRRKTRLFVSILSFRINFIIKSYYIRATNAFKTTKKNKLFFFSFDIDEYCADLNLSGKNVRENPKCIYINDIIICARLNITYKISRL